MSIAVAEAPNSYNGQPEKFQLPQVTGVEDVECCVLQIPDALAPASISRYEVDDPYLRAIPPELLMSIRAREESANNDARKRREAGEWDRMPGTAYQDAEGNSKVKRLWEWGDIVSSEEFFGNGDKGLNDPALQAWQGWVPTAAALSYLSDPFRVTAVTDRRDRQVTATYVTQTWLAGCTDAEAIRSRATGMSEYVKAYIERHRTTSPNEPITMLSIACGTALPTLQAAMHSGVEDATLLLVDKDKKSMALTERLAQDVGFKGNLVSEAVDIFDPQAMAHLREQLTVGGVDRRPHIVDAMGIFEYTSAMLRTEDKEDDPSLLYDPVAFLKAGFDLVRPGGRYIFGQMRSDRPVADFTMGVVRWPYVCMRSPKEVMQIVVKAGIDPSWVNLSLTPEGVYTIASIDKPLEATDLKALEASGSERAGRRLAKLRDVLSGVRIARRALATLALRNVL